MNQPQPGWSFVQKGAIALATENVYFVGPSRCQTSLTQLFLDLKDDESEKTIYIDAGTYDIFREYKDAGIPSPPDDVKIPDYFTYSVFLPPNTRLIGTGKVTLRFAPSTDEITYGESRTWSPLNILGACYLENIEIFCKNGRYCIHDDSHNRYKNTVHHYKNVRCIYELGDEKDGKQLGMNFTTGNGMAEGSTFLFEDCSFRFTGDNRPCFYTHECAGSGAVNSPSLTFKNCQFLSDYCNPKAIMLQSVTDANLRILTQIESCTIQGGIYLMLYSESSRQHYDVTVKGSGNPLQLINRQNNNYPIKIEL